MSLFTKFCEARAGRDLTYYELTARCKAAHEPLRLTSLIGYAVDIIITLTSP
jgi:hypothetical protein